MRVAGLGWGAISAIGLGIVGCAGGDDSDQTPLLILAAANLQLAFEELVPAFEAATGIDADLVLGSSGNLATQIRSGAPADLFFAADEAFVEDLVSAGFIHGESLRIYAVGRIVVVVPPGGALPPTLDALVDPAFRVVTIANPDYAPYGSAAREALRNAGVWDALEPRIVLGENVAQSLQYVRTGNADAGLVALGSVAGSQGAEIPYALVDSALHSPLRQAAGVVVGSRRAAEARALLDFALSNAGQEILARFGYESPSPVRAPR